MPRYSEPAEGPRPALGPTLDQDELETFLSLMPDAAIAVDAQGKVVAVNERAAAMFGYAAADMEGKAVEMFMPARFRYTHRRKRTAYNSNPHARPMGAGLDLRGRRSDGSEVPLDISLAPLKGESGLLVVAALRDITERKEDEERLRLQARAEAVAAEIRLELLSEAPLETSLGLICTRAAELAGARAAALVSVGGSGTGLLASAGDKGTLTALAESLRTKRFLTEGTGTARTARLAGGLTVLAVPVPCAEGARVRRATLAVVLGEGQPALPERTQAVASLAGQAVLALELATVRAERDRMAISAERERIARDLHDLVIQRLFGAGLRLQGALALIDNSSAASRVASTVDELDATIKEIRGAIFSLEAAPSAGLESRVNEAIATASEALGFTPALSFRQPPGHEVPLEAELEAVAVLREALSNAARHARANKVEVNVEVGNELTIQVIDDGVGVGKPKRLSGIANARARAALLGGRLRLSAAKGGGTCFEWRVPLGEPATGLPGKEPASDVVV